MHTDAFPQRDAYTKACFYTEMTEMLFTKTRFYTDVCTYRCFYREILLHTNIFTHRRLYTGMFLHRETFTHRHPGASTHRCLSTAMLLHRNAFTQKHFCTGILLTEYPLHTEAFTHTRTRTLTQRVNFAQKYIYAEAFFSTQIARRYFTKRCFSTSTFNAEMSLHRGAFRLGRL